MSNGSFGGLHERLLAALRRGARAAALTRHNRRMRRAARPYCARRTASDSGNPLFPLGTVLFPGGPLPLRIFEARYIDLVRRCLRENTRVRRRADHRGRGGGRGADRTCDVGTYATIVDFSGQPDGLLGIEARGERRFRIHARRRARDGLNLAEVEWLPDDTTRAAARRVRGPRPRARKRAATRSASRTTSLERQLDDAGWVAGRLAEMLPLPPAHKQHCLELDDPVERLRYLRPLFEITTEPPDRPGAGRMRRDRACSTSARCRANSRSTRWRVSARLSPRLAARTAAPMDRHVARQFSRRRSMDDIKAAEILKALAAGADPARRGTVADVAALQSPDVVRALFLAVDALEQRTRLAARRQATLPRNAGKPWSADEDERLLEAFDGGRDGRRRSRPRTSARGRASRHGSSSTAVSRKEQARGGTHSLTPRIRPAGSIAARRRAASRIGRASIECAVRRRRVSCSCPFPARAARASTIARSPIAHGFERRWPGCRDPVRAESRRAVRGTRRRTRRPGIDDRRRARATPSRDHRPTSARTSSSSTAPAASPSTARPRIGSAPRRLS